MHHLVHTTKLYGAVYVSHMFLTIQATGKTYCLDASRVVIQLDNTFADIWWDICVVETKLSSQQRIQILVLLQHQLIGVQKNMMCSTTTKFHNTSYRFCAVVSQRVVYLLRKAKEAMMHSRSEWSLRWMGQVSCSYDDRSIPLHSFVSHRCWAEYNQVFPPKLCLKWTGVITIVSPL